MDLSVVESKLCFISDNVQTAKVRNIDEISNLISNKFNFMASFLKKLLNLLNLVILESKKRMMMASMAQKG